MAIDYDKEAHDLIRSIYKFIPSYNQIKGTYVGLQFILNTMGLCASITEIWSDRNDLCNFSRNSQLYREDELNAVRRFISEVGSKAEVKDYFLTSRFDVDMIQTSKMTFKEFNGMADTIVDVVLSIKPVTRCLRRLYYIILIDTRIHFNYYMDCENNPQEIKTFNYIWNITGNPQAYKTQYDVTHSQLNRLFIPYISWGAEYYNDGTYTLNNTYFNLFDLDIKIRKSFWKTFRFKLYIREKGDMTSVEEAEYKLILGTDVDIKMDTNGIILEFQGGAKAILSRFFALADLDSMDIFLASTFSMAMGTKYIFQDDDVEIDWDVREYPGLIGESSDRFKPVYLLAEKAAEGRDKTILLYENYTGPLP